MKRPARGSGPIDRLTAFDPETGHLNVVIETIKGSRNKFKYDPRHQVFKLSKVLPVGAVFPFDFGYVPATLAEDGDPLDVLVLMDQPGFVGCLIGARVIGAIKAKQSYEKQGMKRNDRLIAVAAESPEHKKIRSLRQINPALLDEIEHFFVSYLGFQGTLLRIIGRSTAQESLRLVERAEKALVREDRP